MQQKTNSVSSEAFDLSQALSQSMPIAMQPPGMALVSFLQAQMLLANAATDARHTQRRGAIKTL